jgi:hypothetical protein
MQQEPQDEEPVRENGLFCFLNSARPCSSECMAYTVSPAESQSLGDQQKNCVLIVGVERLGRFSGAIMTLLKNKAADEARSSAKPPPNPAGGPR